MKSREEVEEAINYYNSPFSERIDNDINNPKFNRNECTDYMDNIVLTVLNWVLEDN